jgi:hypothetical protein
LLSFQLLLGKRRYACERTERPTPPNSFLRHVFRSSLPGMALILSKNEKVSTTVLIL